MTDHDPRRGIPRLVAAALFFSVMSVLVKRAGQRLPVEMLVLARGVVTLVLSFGILRQRGISPWGKDKKLLVLRGVFGTGGLACFFTAVTLLPLAEVTVIHYLNPVLTAILAAIVLRERVGWGLAAALALAIAGMFLVTRPAALFGAGVTLAPLGVAAAVGGAIFSACAYVTVRRVTRSNDPHVVVFYFPLVAVPATLPFAVVAWVMPTPTEWLLLLGIGVVTQVAQVLLTQGLAMVPAGRGTTVGYIQIVFAAVWGIAIFDERLSATTTVGGLLIVAATLSLLRGRPQPAPRQAA